WRSSPTGSASVCAAVCTRWLARSSSPASPTTGRRLRNTTDVLRRGFDSTLANWPLIAIRIAQSILFVMIVVASIFAAIVPFGIAASFSNFKNLDEPAQAIATFVIEHWPLIAYIFVIVLIVTIVLVAFHAFVE